MKKASGSLMLLLTALIWGTAFVAQRTGMDYVGPISFQTVRSFLGFLALAPVMLVRRKQLGEAFKMPSLRGALTCGVILGAASTMQQIGLATTQAGKAGFISALYVVLVPLLGVFMGRRVRKLVWLGVLLSLTGLYLMSLSAQFSFAMTKGEFWVFISAILYALHILSVDRFAAEADGVALSCMQFLVAGLVGVVPMLVVEKPEAIHLWNARGTLLYTGVLSSGVAYTLQILAQKGSNPTVVTILLSLESVFAVLAGAVILQQSMTGREYLGCVLMFAAVILAQIEVPTKKKKELTE